MQIIKGEDYSANYDAAEGTISLSGIMRLRGLDEYKPLSEHMIRILLEEKSLTIDLTDLEFLNSSGIAMLSKVVIIARKDKSRLKIVGSNAIPWQNKSLNNLKRLMPDLNLTFI